MSDKTEWHPWPPPVDPVERAANRYVKNGRIVGIDELAPGDIFRLVGGEPDGGGFDPTIDRVVYSNNEVLIFGVKPRVN